MRAGCKLILLTFCTEPFLCRCWPSGGSGLWPGDMRLLVCDETNHVQVQGSLSPLCESLVTTEGEREEGLYRCTLYRCTHIQLIFKSSPSLLILISQPLWPTDMQVTGGLATFCPSEFLHQSLQPVSRKAHKQVKLKWCNICIWINDYPLLHPDWVTHTK